MREVLKVFTISFMANISFLFKTTNNSRKGSIKRFRFLMEVYKILDESLYGPSREFSLQLLLFL